VNMAMNLRIPKMVWDSLTNWVTVSFPRTTVLREGLFPWG
jgi:hypothetical protein